MKKLLVVMVFVFAVLLVGCSSSDRTTTTFYLDADAPVPVSVVVHEWQMSAHSISITLYSSGGRAYDELIAEFGQRELAIYSAVGSYVRDRAHLMVEYDGASFTSDGLANVLNGIFRTDKIVSVQFTIGLL